MLAAQQLFNKQTRAQAQANKRLDKVGPAFQYISETKYFWVNGPAEWVL